MTNLANTATKAPVVELVQAARHLASLGLSPGTSGNVSGRVEDRILLSATGSSMGALTTEDLAELSLDGEHLAGPKPTKEWPLHLAFYRKSEHVRAVVHLHSANAVAASCLAPYSEFSALPPITPYFVMRVGQTPLIPYAVPGSAEHAAQLEARNFRFRAALLQNHGSVTAGESIAKAAEAAIELETAAEVLLRLGSQTYSPLSDPQARQLAERYGSSWDSGAGSAGE